MPLGDKMPEYRRKCYFDLGTYAIEVESFPSKQQGWLRGFPLFRKFIPYFSGGAPQIACELRWSQPPKPVTCKFEFITPSGGRPSSIITLDAPANKQPINSREHYFANFGRYSFLLTITDNETKKSDINTIAGYTVLPLDVTMFAIALALLGAISPIISLLLKLVAILRGI